MDHRAFWAVPQLDSDNHTHSRKYGARTFRRSLLEILEHSESWSNWASVEGMAKIFMIVPASSGCTSPSGCCELFPTLHSCQSNDMCVIFVWGVRVARTPGAAFLLTFAHNFRSGSGSFSPIRLQVANNNISRTCWAGRLWTLASGKQPYFFLKEMFYSFKNIFLEDGARLDKIEFVQIYTCSPQCQFLLNRTFFLEFMQKILL